jgi:AraC-like DNA-binding protein
MTNGSLAAAGEVLAIFTMTPAPAVGPSPLESIRLVACLEQRQRDFTFTATSLPGHLIHLVLQGEVEQTCNGRGQRLRPGTLVWYHEDEWVEGRVLHAPWICYTVNFAAPLLPPPEPDQRLVEDRLELRTLFADLLKAWQSPPGWTRDCRCQAHLLRLIASIDAPGTPRPAATATGKLWWEVEAWARQRLSHPPTLTDLVAHFHRSANTLARACHAAVGRPPMQRLKEIRLSLARGLVRHSELTMTEIAARVGYGRVHEFSRDYRQAHGIPPTQDRRHPVPLTGRYRATPPP